MIEPTCAKCGEELVEPGAILLGVPWVMVGEIDHCSKRHLCTTCSVAVLAFIQGVLCE